MRKRLCSAALALVLAVTLTLALAAPAGAADYAGGSGTRNDPYLISTAQQLAKLQANHRNDGDQRITEDMTHNHHKLQLALGPGGLDVILADNLQNRRTAHTG